MCQLRIVDETGKTTRIQEVVDYFQERKEVRDNLYGKSCGYCNVSFGTHEKGVAALGETLLHDHHVKPFIQRTQRLSPALALQSQAASA